MVKVVPDTSVIIHGKLTELLKRKRKKIKLLIPTAVLDELQAQASKGREVGFIGLEQLKKIREICKKKGIEIKFVGERPSLEDIKLAHSGRIDAIIRDVAKKERGVLYTADYVQALVGEAEGVRVKYLPTEIKTTGLKFEFFFTPDTLSVHLKEGALPMAKRGKPGEFKLVEIGKKPLSQEEIGEIIKEISEATRMSEAGSVEINRAGALVLQLGNYRIAVARPPFSDGLEVTIVKPIVRLSLEDYSVSKRLIRRLKERAEGVIIAGPPGSGKTTLSSSLAEFYKDLGRIVKTLESPRDMQVSKAITQYKPLEGDFEKSAEILLLVRPDYTVFDEVRKTRDFQVFADLRLAGVGMVGVVHASNPIDAIQRFIGKVELGMLPHIVDTVIFVRAGKIAKVLELNLVVKVPTGMTEADLARPVVEVRDFETGKLEYEIYTFGEENVIVPVKPRESRLERLAKERIGLEIKRFDPKAEIELRGEKAVVRVNNKIVPRLIGKNGSMITQIEKRLGIRIEVEPKLPTFGREVSFGINEVGNSLEFIFDKKLAGKVANFYVNGEFLFSATVSKRGSIRITKSSGIGKELVRAIASKKEIRVLI